MARRKDTTLVAVIGSLTDTQAAEMTKEIIKAKRKYAPKGTATIANGKKTDVGTLLQAGMRKAIGRR